MRIEHALHRTLEESLGAQSPPRLARALHYAVFPAGGRIRPRICLEVARACGDPSPELSDAAAMALELIHCGSLVHDDLPCFDDAAFRRGRPSVHRAFDQATAVLAGDALIVMAFGWLTREGRDSEFLPGLLGELARATGAASGIIAGQAWESEDGVDPALVHRTKTASLFEAATVMGALAAGQDGESWRECGGLLGRAYQLADDIADSTGNPDELGKPTGQDRKLGRPSLVERLGYPGALGRLDELIDQAAVGVPACTGRDHLIRSFSSYASRLCPDRVRRQVATAAS